MKDYISQEINKTDHTLKVRTNNKFAGVAYASGITVGLTSGIIRLSPGSICHLDQEWSSDFSSPGFLLVQTLSQANASFQCQCHVHQYMFHPLTEHV
jgi:hypothetical protein